MKKKQNNPEEILNTWKERDLTEDAENNEEPRCKHQGIFVLQCCGKPHKFIALTPELFSGVFGLTE